MGKLRKLGKKLGKGIKSLGRKLMKGLGKVGRAFGKLGPLGSIALSFILPGIGSWISGIAKGSSFLAPVAQGLVNAGNFVKNGVGRVFNRITDAVEWSMNKVSAPFMQPGARGAGSAFRDWASEATNGFIKRSEVGLQDSTLSDTYTVIEGGEVKTLGTESTKLVKGLDTRRDLITGEYINPEEAARVTRLQDAGKFRRDLEKIESSKAFTDGTLIKKEVTGGYEYWKPEGKSPYATAVDASVVRDEALKVTADATLPKAPGHLTDPVYDSKDKLWYESDLLDKHLGGTAAKPKGYESITADAIDTKHDWWTKDKEFGSLKERIRGSKQFSTYKTIAPIQMAGSQILAEEDEQAYAAHLAQQQESAYFTAVAQNTLDGEGLTRQPGGSSIGYFDFTHQNPSQDDIYRLNNAYGGILPGGSYYG